MIIQIFLVFLALNNLIYFTSISIHHFQYQIWTDLNWNFYLNDVLNDYDLSPDFDFDSFHLYSIIVLNSYDSIGYPTWIWKIIWYCLQKVQLQAISHFSYFSFFFCLLLATAIRFFSAYSNFLSRDCSSLCSLRMAFLCMYVSLYAYFSFSQNNGFWRKIYNLSFSFDFRIFN